MVDESKKPELPPEDRERPREIILSSDPEVAQQQLEKFWGPGGPFLQAILTGVPGNIRVYIPGEPDKSLEIEEAMRQAFIKDGVPPELIRTSLDNRIKLSLSDHIRNILNKEHKIKGQERG